jgi:hypothetical protein
MRPMLCHRGISIAGTNIVYLLLSAEKPEESLTLLNALLNARIVKGIKLPACDWAWIDAPIVTFSGVPIVMPFPLVCRGNEFPTGFAEWPPKPRLPQGPHVDTRSDRLSIFATCWIEPEALLECNVDLNSQKTPGATFDSTQLSRPSWRQQWKTLTLVKSCLTFVTR